MTEPTAAPKTATTRVSWLDNEGNVTPDPADGVVGAAYTSDADGVETISTIGNPFSSPPKKITRVSLRGK